MRLSVCAKIFGLMMPLLLGGLTNPLVATEPHHKQAEAFDWVLIPEGAEVVPLIKRKVRELAEDGAILPFEQTTEVLNRWLKHKQGLSAAWRQRFSQSREAFRETLQLMSEQSKAYLDTSHRLSLAETALDSARKRSGSLDEQIRSLQNEQKILQQNLQAQLDDFGFQILLQGSTRQEHGSSLSKEELKRLLGEAIGIRAIREVNDALIEKITELQNYEILASRIQRLLKGRWEPVATYPVSISKVWREKGNSIGSITHLFHIVNVYSFSSRQTLNHRSPSSQTLSGLEPEPDVTVVTGVNLPTLLFDNDIDDRNLEQFLERWLRLTEETNDDTLEQLEAVVAAFTSQKRELEAHIETLQAERGEQRCEVFRQRLRIHGQIPELEQAWPSNCEAVHAENLRGKKQAWETEIWPELEREFLKQRRAYTETYITKTVAFGQVSDGKAQPTENPIDAWVRVAQNAFNTLDGEVSTQEYQEEILIIGQKISDYRETTVTYRKVPKAFTILYLADHESDNQVIQIAGVGVKYKFQSQTEVVNLPPPRPPIMPSSSKTPCDLRQLELLFRYNIPLESIAEHCGLATSIDIPPDQEMWTLVKRTTLPEDIHEFILAFPQSRLLPAARLKLQQLQRTQSK